jgi:hypothetical protein
MRPWMHSDRSFDVSYPAVAPHPALDPMLQMLVRKPYGSCHIPCSYFVVRNDQSTEWVRNSTLTTAPELQSVTDFEKRFRRSKDLPCNSLKDYNVALLYNLEQGVSEDELDIPWHAAVDECFEEAEDLSLCLIVFDLASSRAKSVVVSCPTPAMSNDPCM